jgi:hypothetical protein
MIFLEVPVGGFTLPGTLGGASPADSGQTLERIISTAIGVMTVIAFIWFIVQFFIAAVQIIGSGGDKNALAAARGKLSTSVIGLVVVISAIFIIELIGTILGISILNSIFILLYPNG